MYDVTREYFQFVKDRIKNKDRWTTKMIWWRDRFRTTARICCLGILVWICFHYANAIQTDEFLSEHSLRNRFTEMRRCLLTLICSGKQIVYFLIILILLFSHDVKTTHELLKYGYAWPSFTSHTEHFNHNVRIPTWHIGNNKDRNSFSWVQVIFQLYPTDW